MYTRVQFVLTRDLHVRLRRMAEARGESMSALVREILERALTEEEQRRARRRQILARLAEASKALEEARSRPMSGEEIVDWRVLGKGTSCLFQAPFSPEGGREGSVRPPSRP